jgi:hypothetical protein
MTHKGEAMAFAMTEIAAKAVATQVALRGQVIGNDEGALLMDPGSGKAYLLNAAALAEATSFKAANGFTPGWSNDPARVQQLLQHLEKFATDNFDPDDPAAETLIVPAADVATVGSALVTVVSAGSWKTWITAPTLVEPIATALTSWQENRSIGGELHMRGSSFFAGGSDKRWAMFLHPRTGDVFVLDWDADQAAMVWARDKKAFDPNTWQTDTANCEALYAHFVGMANPGPHDPSPTGNTWRLPATYVGELSTAFAACVGPSGKDPLP